MPSSQRLQAAQYVRMSTDHQQYSISNQKDAIAAYALANDIEIVATYEDPGKSGLTLARRPELRKLIADVVGGNRNFETILVYDVSRWGRFQDVDESAHLEYLCRLAGVSVRYCAEPFENDGSPLSNLCKVMKRALAAEYSRELSTKIYAGKARLARLGFRLGSYPGYGLRRRLVDQTGIDKGELGFQDRKNFATDRVILVPGPLKERAIVRWIYRSYVENGMTVAGICRELNARKLPCENGRLWTPGVVHHILFSPKYVGDLVWGKTSAKLSTNPRPTSEAMWISHENALKPIVSRDLFERARQTSINRKTPPTNEELLELVRHVYKRHGRVSVDLLQEHGVSTRRYRNSFGSVCHAYVLCGLPMPRHLRDLSQAKIEKRAREEIQTELGEALRALGGTLSWSTLAGAAVINDELSIQIDATLPQMRVSGLCWRVRRTDHVYDFLLLARLSADGRPIDYFLLPRSIATPCLRVGSNVDQVLSTFRFDDISEIAPYFARRLIDHRMLGRHLPIAANDRFAPPLAPDFLRGRFRVDKTGRRRKATALLSEVGSFCEKRRRVVKKANSIHRKLLRLDRELKSHLADPNVLTALRDKCDPTGPRVLFERQSILPRVPARKASSTTSVRTTNLCPEARQVLGEAMLHHQAVVCLAGMSDERQVEAAQEMVGESRYSWTFAKLLLAATPRNQLVRPRTRDVISNINGIYEAITAQVMGVNAAYRAALVSFADEAISVTVLHAYSRALKRKLTKASSHRLCK